MEVGGVPFAFLFLALVLARVVGAVGAVSTSAAGCTSGGTGGVSVGAVEVAPGVTHGGGIVQFGAAVCCRDGFPPESCRLYGALGELFIENLRVPWRYSREM